MNRVSWMYIKIIALFLIVCLISVTKARADSPFAVVNGYLKAMQSGDVETIKSYLGGKLLKKRIVLLNQNKKYSFFLKNIYKDAEFFVSKKYKKLGNSKRLIDIQIKYPDGYTHFGSFILEYKDAKDWKIIDHINSRKNTKEILTPPPAF